MALVVKDRVQETTTTTGTGTITLAGAVTGFQSFSVIGNGNTTYYTISGGSEWEVGIGTYTSSGTTLSRDTILESSNSGSAVNFSAGSKTVFCTYPAERSMYVDGTTITPATTATLPITSGGTGSSTATFSGANITSLNASSISTGTLGVANGGTGATTLTSNAVILGNTTSAVKFVSPGTSGNVLTSDGSTWASTAPSGGSTSAGGVGTYAFLRNTTDADYDFGGTLAGSSLYPAGIAYRNTYWVVYTNASSTLRQGIPVNKTTSPSGTWQCMGVSSNISDGTDYTQSVTLWVRTS